MAYRVENRTVSEQREVFVVNCDGCGREAIVEYGGVMPQGWFRIVNGITSEGDFCSRECVRQWASGSTETTKIAREAFAKQTGG